MNYLKNNYTRSTVTCVLDKQDFVIREPETLTTKQLMNTCKNTLFIFDPDISFSNTRFH